MSLSRPGTPLEARRSIADVLVVDDDPRSAKLLTGYLEAEGYRVRTAGDGTTAIALAGERAPDVVFLDIMMPGVTGLEVCRALKANERTRLTQVMMVTAMSNPSDQVLGLDTGADDYVTKPVRRPEFLAKARALVRARTLLLELEKARQDLELRNEELQLKKTLAQSLVHDMKNPLTAVMMGLDCLQLDSASVEQQAILRRTRDGTDRMMRMILDLLDVEALEEGHLMPRLELTDLAALARSAVADCADAAGTVRIELDAATASHVHADPRLLRRVLDNLVANAIHHSSDDGTIAVQVVARAEGIEMAVADRGPGIPEEQREVVFDKYQQLDNRHCGATANRGLGLTFCRLAIEAHGGSIWIEGRPGGGALFRTLLPAAVDQEAHDDVRAVVAI